MQSVDVFQRNGDAFGFQKWRCMGMGIGPSHDIENGSIGILQLGIVDHYLPTI